MIANNNAFFILTKFEGKMLKRLAVITQSRLSNKPQTLYSPLTVISLKGREEPKCHCANSVVFRIPSLSHGNCCSQWYVL